MRIAFYAPMKAPTHQVPSGDRTMARRLFGTLERMGHDVRLASSFRAWDRGDPQRQQQLACSGAREAERLVELWRGAPPDLWFTYHLYHKAPDHLGPRVAEEYSLPYVVAEPSVAPARRDGPWSDGHARALAALARADVLLPMTGKDREGLIDAGLPAERIVPLAPFVDAPAPGPARTDARAALAGRFGLAPGRPLAIAVAMMRPGDKLASYRVLAGALAELGRDELQLLVVGDGPGRADVEALLAGRAIMAGEVEAADLSVILAGCDLFVWPAVNEAYGMALLDAQAAGLPVIAGRTPGVEEIVMDGKTGLLTPEGDAAAFARAIASMLDDPDRRDAMAAAAAERAGTHHGQAAAMRTLAGALDLAVRARP